MPNESQSSQGTQQSVLSPIQPSGGSKTIALPPATNLDPQVLAVAQTIKGIESQGNYNAVGDSGASAGAYQWNNGGQPIQQGQTPKNWQNAAKEYLGDATAPMTPANQNYVAYQQIAAYKAQGLSPNSIDALWNGASPDPQNPGQYIHNNPQRATQFQQALQQQVQGMPQTQTSTTPTQPTTPQAPSLLGFGENLIGSGASFLGNVGSALMHPINTVENLASIPVGALQEAGGESTPQTQTFDAVKNQFENRYGSVQNVAHTFYTDPIGMLADISGVAGGAGLIAGGVSKLADVAELGNVASEGAEASGVAGGASTVAQTLNKISQYSNPLTSVIKGATSLASKAAPLATEAAGQVLGMNPSDIENILKNPEQFTPGQIATVSRTGLAQEVQGAFNQLLEQKAETGAEYSPYRETPTNIEVTPDYLDNAFREAGVDIKDGVVSANSASDIRTSTDINKLQNLYNLYKPDFLNGTMDSNKFLNLRNDVQDMAYNENGFKSSKLAVAGEKLRSSLNDTYRSQIGGLEGKDTEYSAKANEIKTLKKGLFDKNGNLLDSAINKIANATGKGKDAQLERLEQLLPGITQRIKILRTIENIQGMKDIKVGTYTRSISQAARVGGILYGAETGNVHLLGAALAMDAISNPENAMAILRVAAKTNPTVVNATLATLARYAVMGGSSLNSSSSQQPQQTLPSTTEPQEPVQNTQQQSSQAMPNTQSSLNTTTQNSAYQDAINAGYTPAEIEQYLTSQ